MPLHEVAHQGKQLQSQKPDGHAHTKNAITLRACTTSSVVDSSGLGYPDLFRREGKVWACTELSLVPRPFYARGRAGREIRAWYQSFAHALNFTGILVK